MAGETPFIVAAREGRLNFIEFMNEKYSVSIYNSDHKTLDGWTAFTYSTINGFMNTATYLAEKVKANVHTTDRFRRNVIHWAARFNNDEILSYLLTLNINYQALDCESMSPIELAKAFHSQETFDILNMKLMSAKATIAERATIKTVKKTRTDSITSEGSSGSAKKSKGKKKKTVKKKSSKASVSSVPSVTSVDT